MASLNLLKLTAVLSLLIPLLIAAISQSVATTHHHDDDEEEEYILDTPFANTRLRSRFLASIRKGTSCNAQNKYNLCNGIWANNGTSLLYCCKKHCRNILSDKNNCGSCQHKCALGQRCCGGKCTNVFNNAAHCGKCDKACKSGVQCQYGICGYV